MGMTNSLANGTVISSFNYTYDSRGRRISMNTLDGNWTYTYDDIGQLTHAVYAAVTTNVPNQDLTYIYDALGNRTQTMENGITTSYTVNNLNQYFSVGQTNYTFDADGNLIREVSPSGTTTYTYNDENRLASMASPQGNWQYAYDGLGNRTVTTANGTTTRDVIDPIGLGNVVGEYDSSGNLIAHYDHALGLLSRNDGGGGAFEYTFDAIGNVQQLVTAAGLVANNYAYAPFGGLLRSIGAAPNPFQFAGQNGVMKESYGLTLMRNRFYNPGIGRFASHDPVGLAGQDVNLYRYVANDPLSRIDPEGLVYREFNWDKFGSCAKNQLLKTAAEMVGGLFVEHWVQHDGGPIVKLFIDQYGTRAVKRGLQSLGNGMHVIHLAIYLAELTDCIHDAWEERNGGLAAESIGPPHVDPPGLIYYSYPTSSDDPNQLTGPAGYGANGFISSANTLAYRIDFENVTNATAPAQQVIITDQLNTNFDWTTFNVTEVGFGSTLIALPPGTAHYEANVSASYLGTNFQVQIQIGINPISGQIYANFHTIDPNTSLPPPVNIGFLPPEDGTGRGQGHVTYTIHAKSGVTTGTQLRNVALISFDNQPAISTDQVDPNNAAAGTDPNKQALITIDAVAPTSHVAALPAQSSLLQVPVSWTGQDDVGGSGVGSYDIYVSDNGGAWTAWLSGATATNATFQDKPQHTYGFYSRAHDNAGNVEAAHVTADTTTLIVANPQFQLTVAPTSTNLNSTATFSYTVTVKNIGSLSLNNVVMSNTMPAGISLDWVQYGRGVCNIGDSSIVWSLGNMNTNISASMNVTADTLANGIWTNFFAVADSDGAASSSTTQVLYIGVSPAVLLNIALTNNQVLLSWPSSAGNYGLQVTTNLASSASWAAVANASTTNGSTIRVNLPVTRTNQFFRLRSP